MLGVAVSNYLRYKFYWESFSSLGRTRRLPLGSFLRLFSLVMLLSTLINHLISQFSYLYSLGFLFWVSHFFSLTLLTITQEGTIKKGKESDSASQSTRSGQLLTLIIH